MLEVQVNECASGGYVLRLICRACCSCLDGIVDLRQGRASQKGFPVTFRQTRPFNMKIAFLLTERSLYVIFHKVAWSVMVQP